MTQIPIAPPSLKQLRAIEKNLKLAMFLETAAAQAGVSRRILNAWLRFGRAGRPGFVEFTEMCDKASSDLASELISTIHRVALETQSASTLMWLYKQRFGQREREAVKRDIALEAVVDEALSEVETPGDLDEIERRATGDH